MQVPDAEKLSRILDIEDDNDAPPPAIIVPNAVNAAVTPVLDAQIAFEEEAEPLPKEARDDIDEVRTNLKHLLDKGQELLDANINLALGSENPRAFETAANVLKTVAEINGDLIAVHERKQKMEQSRPAPSPGMTPTGGVNVQGNAVFVGNSKDLLNQLKQNRKDLKKSAESHRNPAKMTDD